MRSHVHMPQHACRGQGTAFNFQESIFSFYHVVIRLSSKYFNLMSHLGDSILSSLNQFSDLHMSMMGSCLSVQEKWLSFLPFSCLTYGRCTSQEGWTIGLLWMASCLETRRCYSASCPSRWFVLWPLCAYSRPTHSRPKPWRWNVSNTFHIRLISWTFNHQDTFKHLFLWFH